MYISLKRYSFTLILLYLFFPVVYTQEYRYEIGGGAGVIYYMGDANPDIPFRYSRPAMNVHMRNNLNFRWALMANMNFGKVTGSTKRVLNSFPVHQEISFERFIIDLGIRSEFNFQAYSDQYYYKNTRHFTPFIFGGLGWTFSPHKEIHYTGFNIPFGVGFKYKIISRINLIGEISAHKLFTDKFDVTGRENEILKGPYNIKNNIFKNNDWYFVWLISITWDIGYRNEYCK